MIYILIFSSLITLLYVIIITSFLIGWVKTKAFKPNQIEAKIPVSIIIPFRNEGENIANIIHDIINQLYPKNLIDLILVNDHSSDNSLEIANLLCLEELNFRVLELKDEEGKKAALRYGVENSHNELIITTDADCRIGEEWLETIVSFYLKYKPEIIVGPVLNNTNKGLFNAFQNLEFLSLVVSTAGAIGISKPIMANGANLAFNKKLYNEISLNENIASGDDVYLIHEAKRNYRSGIKFLKSNPAVAVTKPSKNINEFIQQRVRWSSKTINYSDIDTLIVACIVFLINLLIILILVTGIYNPFYLIVAAIIFFIKLIVDFPLLYQITRFFNRLNLMRYYLIVQIIYPFYILITVLTGIFSKRTWKGRIIK